jgi:CubicO group peptidase (beta-lactamase class C family)
MATPPDPLAALLAAHADPGVPCVSVATLTDPDADPQVATSAGVSRYALFQAASISKAVAALAALVLVDRGALGLDDDVNARLKSWRLPTPAGCSVMVTLRNLLCHGGALSIRSFPGYPGGAPLPTVRQILDGQPPSATAPVRITGLPGLAPRYSGGGYLILQQLLEDVGGKPMPELVAELVLRPLRMSSAQYLQPDPEEAIPGMAGGAPLAGGWHVYPELAAAGLWCTPVDLVRFAAGVQAAVADRPGAVLSKNLATAMITEQLPGWGLGLELAGTGAGARFGHSGQNQGYLCEFTATVAPGPAIAVMTASDLGARVIHPLLPAIRTLLNWPDPAACTVSGAPAAPAPSPSQVAGLAALCAGGYRTGRGRLLTLSGTIWNWALTIDGQPPIPLEAESASLLSCPVLPLTVELDISGLSPKITVRQPGSVITATHV